MQEFFDDLQKRVEDADVLQHLTAETELASLNLHLAETCAKADRKEEKKRKEKKRKEKKRKEKKRLTSLLRK